MGQSRKQQQKRKRDKKRRASGPWRGKTRPPEVESMTREELEAIVERTERGALTEEDRIKLRSVIDTLGWVTDELAQKSITIARLRALFGLSTSEKAKDLFDDDTEAGDFTGDQPTGEESGEDGAASAEQENEEKKKRPGHGRNGADAYTGAAVVPVKHQTLCPGDGCPECSGKLYDRKDRPRKLIHISGQPPLKATRYERQVLRCGLCGTEFVAEPPEGITEDVTYDETAAAMIGLLKYGSGMPFHRLQGLERNLGVPLPASIQWEVVRDAAVLIKPAFDELVRQAAQGEVVHNDDTTARILERMKELAEAKAREPNKKRRTGTFTTSIVSLDGAGRRVALFFTGKNHAGENLNEVLAQRAKELNPPIQMSDGLDRNLPRDAVTVAANCLVHGRRYFVRLAENFPSECRHVIERIGEVYKHDAVAKHEKLSAQERMTYHQKKSGPVLESLRSWMIKQFDLKRVEPNGPLGGAFNYMLERWDKLTLFLRKPGAPLDNNVAERALKKAILHRKNALFFRTQNGADVADMWMSLIYTAELCGANVFEYLVALQEHAEEVARSPHDWMPWNYQAALGSQLVVLIE